MSSTKKSLINAACASFEPLEPRKLLSATLSAKGTLVADGTSGSDTIIISRDPKRPTKILVTINGIGAKFSSGAVKRIEITGQRAAIFRGSSRMTRNPYDRLLAFRDDSR